MEGKKYSFKKYYSAHLWFSVHHITLSTVMDLFRKIILFSTLPCLQSAHYHVYSYGSFPENYFFQHITMSTVMVFWKITLFGTLPYLRLWFFSGKLHFQHITLSTVMVLFRKITFSAYYLVHGYDTFPENYPFQHITLSTLMVLFK